jgi:hypothetical protein
MLNPRFKNLHLVTLFIDFMQGNTIVKEYDIKMSQLTITFKYKSYCVQIRPLIFHISNFLFSSYIFLIVQSSFWWKSSQKYL